jgi:L-amino acid N-acyltransferase YncA
LRKYQRQEITYSRASHNPAIIDLCTKTRLATGRQGYRGVDAPHPTKSLPGMGRFGEARRMDSLAISVRFAKAQDASSVARVYIDAWHDTYPAILSKRILCAMTPKGQSARWRAVIRAQAREQVLVAESVAHGVIGMTSFGPARDRGMGLDGEIYTLYVDPAHFGCGTGRALLKGAFVALRGRGFSSCVIWAHALNPARFFYEALGGRLVGERETRMMGDPVPETAFGWRKLAVAERSKTTS